MKFACLEYKGNFNLGDQIQSLAVTHLLPGINRWVNRDRLALEKPDEPHRLIMQGWFSMTPKLSFPPPSHIEPIFIGFHISPFNEGYKHFLGEASVEYLKKHEPIGCRDRKTMQLLIEKGISAFQSHCLTLTFPTRNKVPKAGKVILTDTEGINIPETLTRNALRASHRLSSPDFPETIKRDMAGILLRLYREQARLVITTRLHCALPCIAMGIPVVFFGNREDSRFSVLQATGMPIYQPGTPPDEVDWEPEVPDIDPIRRWMHETIRQRILWTPGENCSA